MLSNLFIACISKSPRTAFVVHHSISYIHSSNSYSESLSNHYTSTMPIDDIALTLRSIPTSTPPIHERGVYTKSRSTDKTSTTTNTVLNPRRTKSTHDHLVSMQY